VRACAHCLAIKYKGLRRATSGRGAVRLVMRCGGERYGRVKMDGTAVWKVLGLTDICLLYFNRFYVNDCTLSI
jgi:hypothetical protein